MLWFLAKTGIDLSGGPTERWLGQNGFIWSPDDSLRNGWPLLTTAKSRPARDRDAEEGDDGASGECTGGEFSGAGGGQREAAEGAGDGGGAGTGEIGQGAWLIERGQHREWLTEGRHRKKNWLTTGGSRA